MTDKEYLLKREDKGIWYSYPTGNWYGDNITELFERLEKDLNKLYHENERLKSENNMLKVTIGRNEAYINQLQNKGKWDINAYKYNPKGVR